MTSDQQTSEQVRIEPVNDEATAESTPVVAPEVTEPTADLAEPAEPADTTEPAEPAEPVEPAEPAEPVAQSEPPAAVAPHPVPRPPRPVPGPPPARPASTPTPAPEAAPVPPPPRALGNPGDWGRVDDDGTVFVRTEDGEREIGTWQAGDVDGALQFFGHRFDGISAELDLLESRLRSGKINPDEARSVLRKHRAAWLNAPALGDFAGLTARMGTLDDIIDVQRTERAEVRAKAQEAARATKERLVGEAEALGQSSDWRGGVTRFRQLLDDWKAQPRLERHADDELWHRFSTARTTYTRRRKAHFSELSAKREGAREIKERLAIRAEALATSTEWGPTSAELRALMDEWRTAGGAQKDVDDELWGRFRAASDAFFAARTEHFTAQDSEFAGNLAAKELLLAEAEKLLPVREPGPAKAALRSINERWALIGKVPRDSMKSVEARLHAVERSVEEAESQRWARTDPELRARAESTVTMLRDSVAKLSTDLEKATAKGDTRAATAAEEALVARRSWLAEAERALADFSG
jgi:hypothetical protein